MLIALQQSAFVWSSGSPATLIVSARLNRRNAASPITGRNRIGRTESLTKLTRAGSSTRGSRGTTAMTEST
jgi:hypothetical protein